MLELRCGDVVAGCDGVVRGETQEEVLARAAEHAEEAHGLIDLDAPTRRALASAIHTP
jgi:predicted small metal-binding protein